MSQGSSLFSKYIKTYPKEIRSSLRLGCFPFITFGEINLIVPLIDPVYLGSICFPVLEERYFRHKPKSIIYMTFGSLIPNKKFSGLTSLYTISLEWIHSNLSNSCNPIKQISDTLQFLFSKKKY